MLTGTGRTVFHLFLHIFPSGLIFGSINFIALPILQTLFKHMTCIIILKSCAKMDKLLNYLNDVNMDDHTEKIINGELNPNSIDEKVQQFNALNVEKRYAYMGKLNQRISKIKKPHKLLSVLLLVDHIYQCNPRMVMPQAYVTSLQASLDKQSVILMNILSYYHYFLKCNITNRFNIETVNPEDQFEEVESFCEISVMKIIEFFKICFVFQQGILQLPKHKLLIKSILGSILVRFREDLKIINIFIRNNIEIVFQQTVKHPLANRIYTIYQKLLQINREISKLQRFNPLLQARIEFPKYEVDVQKNRELQFAMRNRKEENQRMIMESDICVSEKQSIHDCYVEEQRSIHTTESFLLSDEVYTLL